ncbi:MAG: Phospholipid biosynthesis protein PlsY, probable glycerol-3-phosphate acyltransferase [Chloroflexi bacterium]|jgi:glycerol-3-phosphate acyltransferase PlsY|nr:MAG: Phospholipid biosynthesis protein PlsY, probable glycerol-3-phosphate acyltransferase [Chloroflexota bacterium]
MNDAIVLGALALSAYLAGSVLWGDLISRHYGVDIWAMDTHNPGAGNVARSVGKAQAVAVYVADAMTAATVMLVAGALPQPEARIIAIAGILLGTFFSLYRGFRGGIGLAKFMGLALAMNPAGFMLVAPLGILAVAWLKNPGLAGGIVVAGTVLFSTLIYHDVPTLVLIAGAGITVWARSRMQARFVEGRP